MKNSTLIVFALVLAMVGRSTAQSSEQTFKAGAYRGVLTLTTSAEGYGESSATLRVRGRSTGTSMIKLIGAPQFAQSVLGGSDDRPVKLFRLEYDAFFDAMYLTEIQNADSNGTTTSIPVNPLTVKGDSVTAIANYQLTMASVPVNLTAKLRLTRTGK